MVMGVVVSNNTGYCYVYNECIESVNAVRNAMGLPGGFPHSWDLALQGLQPELELKPQSK